MKKTLSGKINILFVIVQMDIMGGSERLVHNLARGLDRNFFDPSIAWFFCDKPLKEFKALDIPLFHVPKIKRIDFSSMRKLARIIKDNQIHVVNAHHFMSMVYAFYGCKIKNNIKLIYTEHSKWELEHITWKWRRMGNYLLNHLDGTVGVSAEVAKFIKETFRCHPSKVHIIQNGVDERAFGRNIINNEQRWKLGIGNSDKIIGMVANLKKVKNHLFLLKAFSELLKEDRQVKLLLIGQGLEGDNENTESEIRDFINNNGLNKSVLLLGFRSDIPDLLNIMDVFCLTSFKEGLPISLIEAMAAGLPVVGTDVEGIRDVIVQNKNGFLVQAGDVTGLKKVLSSLLQNESLRAKMGQESKSLVNRIYSLDRCINQYQDLFMSTMNK